STKTLKRVLPLTLAAPLLIGVLALGQGPPKKIKKLIHLDASQIDPNANGIAKVFMKTKGNKIERFQLIGANLKVGATYTLVVDGSAIATKAVASDSGDPTTSGGAVEFIYFKDDQGDAEEGSEPLPARLDPVTNIRHVELQDDKKEVVLSGDFSQ